MRALEGILALAAGPAQALSVVPSCGSSGFAKHTKKDLAQALACLKGRCG